MIAGRTGLSHHLRRVGNGHFPSTHTVPAAHLGRGLPRPLRGSAPVTEQERPDPLADRNQVVLVGTVRAEPEWFERPEGHACCFELDVDPGAGTPRARVPVAWIDPPRKGAIVRAGRRVVVVGHLHQRFFRAQGRTLARLEVAAQETVSARSRARAQAVVGAATG